MAIVLYNADSEMYELYDREHTSPQLVSRHRTAETAKSAGKRYGKQNDVSVTYRGPRGGEETIHTISHEGLAERTGADAGMVSDFFSN